MVDIIGAIKQAFGIATRPYSANAISITEAVEFYYSYALIPGIIAIIVAYLILGAPGAVSALITIFIANVIGLFIIAAVVHFFGKFLFRKFSSSFFATFSAVTYYMIPTVFFYWITPLTLSLSNAAFSIWGLVILTMSLMKLQMVSGVAAALSWLVPVIILFVFAFILIYISGGSITSALSAAFVHGNVPVVSHHNTTGSFGTGSPFLSATCISYSSYICSQPTANVSSSGNITITINFEQQSGYPNYGAIVSIAPATSPLNSEGFPQNITSNSIGTLYSASLQPVSFQVPSYEFSNGDSSGSQFSGYVWLNYSPTSGGPSTSAVKAANIKVTVG